MINELVGIGSRRWLALFLVTLGLADTSVWSTVAADQPTLWRERVGGGFEAGVENITLQMGGHVGLATLGSIERHHIALFSASYGNMLSSLLGKDRWHAGNWEFRAELFGGWQFEPEGEWFVGITPHFRYNFATGTRLVPFVDLGAGVSATSIGPPDLSNVFEFNLQATAGCHLFLTESVALTTEARFMHVSCAGLSDPNLGINGSIVLIGLTWFF